MKSRDGKNGEHFADVSIEDGLYYKYSVNVSYFTNINNTNDAIYGSGNDDIFYGYGGDDYLSGLNGNDILYGGADNDLLNGGFGNDQLFGDAGRDYLFGGSGNDSLTAGGGTGDYLAGGAGNDCYYIGAADVSFYIYEAGGEGYDRLYSSAQWLVLSGLYAEIEETILTDGGIHYVILSDLGTRLYGNSGTDIVYGGAGREYLYGNGGDDDLYAAGGDDFVFAGLGNDIVRGATGNDYLVGDAGNDTINGGSGSDTIIGASGADRIIYDSTMLYEAGTFANLGVDRIYGFEKGIDKIDLQSIFSALQISPEGRIFGKAFSFSTDALGTTSLYIDSDKDARPDLLIAQFFTSLGGNPTAKDVTGGFYAPSPYESGPVDTVSPSGQVPIDGLLNLTRWQPQDSVTYITYSFTNFDSVWSQDRGTGYGGVSYEDPGNYQPFTDEGKVLAREALRLWSEVANIKFVEVTESATQVGDIRFSFTDALRPEDAGVGYYPTANTPRGGDVWIDPAKVDFSSGGDFPILLLLHEIGHALGLKHPFETGGSGITLPPEYRNYLYTTMAYDLPPYDGSSDFLLYAETPMLFDILAIQYLYGANNATRTGNDRYQFDPVDAHLVTIYDKGGTDWFDLDNQYSDTQIDINPGHFSAVGFADIIPHTIAPGQKNIAIGYDVWIENVQGGHGWDLIVGNDLNNILNGSDGFDTLKGGNGRDTLRGEAGADWVESDGGADLIIGGRDDDIILITSRDTGIVVSFSDIVSSGTVSGVDQIVGANFDGQVKLDLSQLFNDLGFANDANSRGLGTGYSLNTVAPNFFNILVDANHDGVFAATELIARVTNGSGILDATDFIVL